MSCTDKMYLTGNDICSDNPRDLSDNARVFDAYVNSAEFSVTDRFGIDRLTLTGIQNKADTAIDGFAQLIDDKIIAQGGVEIANEWSDSIESPPSIGFVKESLHYVTPEMFGAVGDGVADDFRALQDALDKGGLVLCRKGANYRISNTLWINSGTTLDLNSSTITRGFARASRGSTMLYPLKGKRNISIKNGDLDSNGTEFFGLYNITSNVKSNTLYFENVRFLNVVGGHAADVGISYQVMLYRCQFLGYAPLDDGGRDFSEAVQIDPAVEEGLGLNKNITLVECYAGANPNNSDPRFGAWGALVGNHSVTNPLTKVEGVKVIRCEVEGAVKAGVRVLSWNNTIIEGNTFTDCRAGVLIESGSSASKSNSEDVKVAGNTFNSCAVAINAVSSTATIDNLNVFNNTFVNCGSDLLLGNIKSLKFTGNNVNGGSTSINIPVTSTGLDTFDISNNSFDDCYTCLTGLSKLKNGRFSNNSVNKMTNRAIHLTDATHAVDRFNISIDNNTFSNTEKLEVIRFDSGASGNIFVDNNHFHSDEAGANVLVKTTVTGGGLFVRNNTYSGAYKNIVPYDLNSNCILEGVIYVKPEGNIPAALGSEVKYIGDGVFERYLKTTPTGDTGWIKQ